MSLLTYFLQTALLQLLAYGGYLLLLDREQLGHGKRYYLLGSLVLSLVVPLLPTLVVLPPLFEGSTVVEVLPVRPVFDLPDFTGAGPRVQTVDPGSNSSLWPYLLGAIYLFGVTVQFAKLGKFLLHIRNSLVIAGGNITTAPVAPRIKWVALPYPVSTHTFWRWVFYSADDPPGPEIRAHEAVHARQLHSIDRLFVAVLRAVFWFNPVLIFYDRAIRLNHEVLADRAVISSGLPVAHYQRSLLDLLARTQISYPPLSSGANFHLTKKRFNMMYATSPRRSVAVLRFSSLFLLWVVLLIGFGHQTKAQTSPPPPSPAPAPPPPPGEEWKSRKAGGGSLYHQELPTGQQLSTWREDQDYHLYLDFQPLENAALDGFELEDFSQYYTWVNSRDEKEVFLVSAANFTWPDVLPPPPYYGREYGTPQVSDPRQYLRGYRDAYKEQAAPPSSVELLRWRDAATYGVWIDGKRIDNTQLEGQSPEKFFRFNVSELEKNAVNYGKHLYQVDLMTVPPIVSGKVPE